MPGSKPDYEGHIPDVPAAEEAAEGEGKAEEGEAGTKKKFWQKVNVKGMKVHIPLPVSDVFWSVACKRSLPNAMIAICSSLEGSLGRQSNR